MDVDLRCETCFQLPGVSKSKKTMDSFDMSPECGTDISEVSRCTVYAAKIVLQFVLFGFC
jgi:hypothetical protein